MADFIKKETQFSRYEKVCIFYQLLKIKTLIVQILLGIPWLEEEIRASLVCASVPFLFYFSTCKKQRSVYMRIGPQTLTQCVG
jgi:hypothetical protein